MSGVFGFERLGWGLHCMHVDVVVDVDVDEAIDFISDVM